jgi:hypothetical protein
VGASRIKFTLRAPDGSEYNVGKVHAFAILSGHPRSSKERRLRVEAMARFVSLRPSELLQRCVADPGV